MTPSSFASNISSYLFAIKIHQKKIDTFLSLFEKPQPKAIIDKEKLKYYISNDSIWDHFSIIEQAYKSSSVEEKTSLLNRYYKELYQKYYR